VSRENTTLSALLPSLLPLREKTEKLVFHAANPSIITSIKKLHLSLTYRDLTATFIDYYVFLNSFCFLSKSYVILTFN